MINKPQSDEEKIKSHLSKFTRGIYPKTSIDSKRIVSFEKDMYIKHGLYDPYVLDYIQTGSDKLMVDANFYGIENFKERIREKKLNISKRRFEDENRLPILVDLNCNKKFIDLYFKNNIDSISEEALQPFLVVDHIINLTILLTCREEIKVKLYKVSVKFDENFDCLNSDAI